MSFQGQIDFLNLFAPDIEFNCWYNPYRAHDEDVFSAKGTKTLWCMSYVDDLSSQY